MDAWYDSVMPKSTGDGKLIDPPFDIGDQVIVGMYDNRRRFKTARTLLGFHRGLVNQILDTGESPIGVLFFRNDGTAWHSLCWFRKDGRVFAGDVDPTIFIVKKK